MKPGELVTPAGVLVLGTEQMHADRQLWLEARRWRRPQHLTMEQVRGMDKMQFERHGYRIGSSDVPSILDVPGVDTPAHVYRDKVMGVSTKPNEAMEWGHLLEDSIAAEWCRRNRAVIDEIGLIARQDAPWHQSTIDRRVRECPTVKGMKDRCGCEVKNVGFQSASRWHADLPDRIVAQIVHQLYVTGYDHMHYAALVGGNQLKQGIVWADRETKLTEYVIGEVNRFREKHLLAGVEPEWNVTDKAAKMVALDMATHPEKVGELDVADVGWVMEYAEAAAEESAAKRRKEQAKAKLAQMADGAQFVKFSGELAYRYGPQTRSKVNLDRLAEKYPQAYADEEIVNQGQSYTLYIDKAYKVKR
jgi:predicted phage-related endonuclease